MANPNNFAVVTGNIANKPQLVGNKDGSHTFLVSVAVTRNYRNRNGEYETDFINMQAYIPANASDKQMAYYLNFEKGQPISATYAVQSYRLDNDKNTRYNFVIDNITSNESASAREARHARRAQYQENTAADNQQADANAAAASTQADEPQPAGEGANEPPF